MLISPAYDVAAMQTDMFSRGWLVIDLSRAAGVSHMTVARFFDGRHQTPRTAKKLAKALGRSAKHYLLPTRPEAA